MSANQTVRSTRNEIKKTLLTPTNEKALQFLLQGISSLLFSEMKMGRGLSHGRGLLMRCRFHLPAPLCD
jgi:hypothetical protein